LYANRDKALSAKELEQILKVRRQGIHQALRALEQKGWIERGMVDEGRNVYYAIITQKGADYIGEVCESEKGGKCDVPVQESSCPQDNTPADEAD